MIDLRNIKTIDLTSARCLKEEVTYQFEDTITKKKLIAKFIADYPDESDNYLIAEFKKLALLSAEPEIATVYFLASGNFGTGDKSCYVMDFIEGQSLGTFLESNTNVSLEFAIDFLSQLSRGMDKAHHYEIRHGDLHEENILINNFGYVKLIDFLWLGNRSVFEESANEDFINFRQIVNSINYKLTDSDKGNFILIKNYLNSITSFRNVASNLLILNEISSELALLGDESKDILAQIIAPMTDDLTLKHLWLEKNIDIPQQCIPELNDKVKAHIEAEKNDKVKLKYSDEVIVNMDESIRNQFAVKLHELKQAGFIDWDIQIENKGVKFIGPYQLEYHLSFTIKLFRWKKLNEQFQFLQLPNRSLTDLILGELK
ncbi:protein kinase [Fluviicola sp.]|uniref:protein kinase domain-containing protein n=1 Tax=Fluviicola sp. TaxID=1917219 RepID=UPI00260D88A3|nr:protein kinase [Fluviicola sp.]